MFELTFLGTGASTPSAERGLPALMVSCGGRRVLVDCGEGTQRQSCAPVWDSGGLERVLLTHRHLDHVLGLAGLIATLGLLRTGGPLGIHGGRETLSFVERYLRALWPERSAPLAIGLVAPVRGADALVIEATFLEADAAMAADYGHLTAAQAGRFAAEAGVGMLYLTHLSGRYDSDAVAAEARRYFPNVRIARDFDKLRVPERGRAERPSAAS